MDATMDLKQELFSVTEALADAGIDHALCGGIAVVIHGYPRATRDIDLLVRREDLERAEESLKERGYTIPAGIIPFDAGKPTGMSLHEDGRLFVADTHYHRVAIFAPGGELLDEIGTYGMADGCFIYPTDVAFAPDGRLFVSEYGGNDRVSVFTSEGRFLFSFGSPGSTEGQFARPSAVSIDETRRRLYVADACNHRVAVYDLDGRLLGYIGAAGRGPGQLRYPYDLSLMVDGTIVVCEYGNNRIQLFSAEGKSLAVYGGPGRQLGQLAFPWGVAVDARRRAYVVDAGNNRIQVWQL